MPQTDDDVKRLGHLGSLAGAVCCQQFGTLPEPERNAIHDSLRRDKNNLKLLLDVDGASVD